MVSIVAWMGSWVAASLCLPLATTSGPATSAATQPCVPATTQAADATATQPVSSGDPRVDAILDRLERRGDAIEDLSAKLTFQRFDELVEERLTRHGELLYRRDEPNARFLVRFDDMVIDRVIRKQKAWYVFDGRWFVEKQESTKTVVRREVVRPGERINPFKLGQGPFPLPFGQKKADILGRFVVKLVEPIPGDPPESDHLLLVPRTDSDMADRYRKLDFYVARKLELPVRIRLYQKDDKIVTADFANVAVNTGLAAGRFELPVPEGWQLIEEPLETMGGQP